jgi:hypothetical protein
MFPQWSFVCMGILIKRREDPVTASTVCFLCVIGVFSLEVDSVVEHPHPSPGPVEGPGALDHLEDPMIVSDPISPPPGIEPVHVSPGIGVGVVFEPTPAVELSVLSRCRMRTDRAGLNLRAGEIVLCAIYEPADLGMVVLVRCESDGHSPGALISAEEVEFLGPALVPMAPSTWHKPGQRHSL